MNEVPKNPQDNQQDSPIEELSKRLNTPGDEKLTELHRAGFHEEDYNVPSDFKHDHEKKETSMRTSRHHNTIKWFFIGAVVFFLGALGFAFFFLSGNRNVVSADKIDITVSGPVIVAAGDTLPLAIEIKNRNATELQIADLLIEYPNGTRSAENVGIELPRTRLSFGDIEAGERVATATKAVLFSEEGTEQEIVVSLEYRVAGSNAIFVKESSFKVRIGSSPLSLSLSAPKSLNSGQDIELILQVESNTSVPLEDVVLQADYPFGFEFSTADPDPTFSETLWALGDIEPEGDRTIRIRGKLSGQDEEDRIFRFSAGLASERDSTQLGTAFAQTDHTVKVSRPFLDARMTINGESEDFVSVKPGGTVRVDIAWRNNLPTKLTDGVVEVEVEGDSVDEKTFSALKGFYDSAKNTVLWDKRSASELSVMDAGDQGTLSFTFGVFGVSQDSSGRIDPDVTITLKFTANAVSEGDTPEEIRSDAQRTVRVISEAKLAGRAVHTVGPLETQGPLPPQVEQKTIYTIIWTITNAVNDVSNATVRAVLPSYISWENVSTPSSENITYKESSGEVIWNAGSVRSGTGFSTPSRTVSFQIGLTPSISQLGTSPVLIQDATLSAKDDVTGQTIGSTVNELTTLLTTDPGFVIGQERVVQ